MKIAGLFDILVVTPSDTVDLVRPAQASVAQTSANPNFVTGASSSPKAEVNVAEMIMVAVTGNVVFIDKLGNTQTMACVAGFGYPGRFTRIKSTSTTATGITAFFPVFQ